MDATTVLFWTFFSLTLAGLGSAVATGLARRRRLHLFFAPVSLVLLTVTIVFAERMASSRVFPEEEMRIHLWFAKSAAVLALPVIVSGIYVARTARGRRTHLLCVLIFLIGTLIATGTGIWVFSLSAPR